MLLTSLFFAALGLHSPHAAPTRDQVFRQLGVPRPSNRLDPEEVRAGYLALTHGDPKEKTIALTFDDGPHGLMTNRLVDVLNEYRVRATFFVVGKMADRHPDNIRYEAMSGDLVEDHTYDHPCLDLLTSAQVSEEYRKCAATIQRITGKAPRFCRPPGGDFNDKVLKAATDQRLCTTLWTDDPGDYRFLPASVIAQKVIAMARPGGIILLHDGIPGTVEAMPAMITALRAKGFRFVTLDELETEVVQANTHHLAGK